jgi:hypothetical protein
VLTVFLSCDDPYETARVNAVIAGYRFLIGQELVDGIDHAPGDTAISTS